MKISVVGAAAVAIALVPGAAQARAQAQAQAQDAEQLRTLLQEMQQAKAAAEQAAKDAEAAEAKLQSLLDKMGDVPSAPVPPQVTPTETSSIAGRKVAEALEQKSDGIANFTSNYLSGAYVRDGQKSTGLGFVLGGSENGGYAELGPIVTQRYYNPIDSNRFSSSSVRFSPVFRVKANSDGDYQIGSISDGEFASSDDLGFGFDLRWTRTRARNLEAVRADMIKVLEKITTDCNTNKAAGSPVQTFESPACQTWLRESGEPYKRYRESVAPLWGLDEDGDDLPPKYFAGIEGTYGFQKETFFPLLTSENTSIPLIAALPADLKGSEDAGNAPLKRTFQPFHAKIYGGFSLTQGDVFSPKAVEGKEPNAKDRWEFAAAGSFGWRKEFRYPEDTQGQTRCYDVTEGSLAGFSNCRKINLAAPFEVDGVPIGSVL